MRQRILKLMKFRRKEETLLLPYRNNRNHKRCYYLIEITGITLRILLAIFENKLYNHGKIVSLHFIPLIHLLCNLKCVPLNPPHQFLSSSTLLSYGNPLVFLCILDSVLLCLVICFCLDFTCK